MGRRYRVPAAALLLVAQAAAAAPPPVADPASRVNPFIGTLNRGAGVVNGGNVYPGAVLPFGMASFSPQQTPLPGKSMAVPGAGGYDWRGQGVQGFSLTHVSGTGCAGAGGDIPLMPITGDVRVSPTLPEMATRYASLMRHSDEHAAPGAYDLSLDNGVAVALGVTLRTGLARFTWPADRPAVLLVRPSDSALGSSDATIRIDAAHRTISGSVTSGNFCGTLAPDRRRSYYTLHFVAVFDEPFELGGTWSDATVHPGAAEARGGTSYGSEGAPPGGKGSGGWIRFPGHKANVRIGLSYVDEAGARANLAAEAPAGTTLEQVRAAAHAAWNKRLGQIAIAGGSAAEQTVFYTALYHALLAPNLLSDVDGRYPGFDGQVHRLGAGQQAQYANFSGWDQYRTQVQLITWLDPQLGGDYAQSLLNQADQNKGVWDRWTHITGATGVMNGDPSAPALAAIHAFGGTGFDVKRAYASLKRAATVPTAEDLGRHGCRCCASASGQGSMPGSGCTIFPSMRRAGDRRRTRWRCRRRISACPNWRTRWATRRASACSARSGDWRNLWNPQTGYIQQRRADGSWAAFDPASDDGFVEGSGAQYLWMVPFDPAGLFALMGGRDKARARLDDLFHNPDGSLSGDLHAEMANEPSIAAPWLYNFLGAPWAAQQVLRATMHDLWTTDPDGLPGNDDLGTMSAWYVWSALGLYPIYPGRAELIVASPLFPQATVTRPGGTLIIRAEGTGPYVRALRVNGKAQTASWLPPSIARGGGTLDFTLGAEPDRLWGSRPQDIPPSFGPR